MKIIDRAESSKSAQKRKFYFEPHASQYAQERRQESHI